MGIDYRSSYGIGYEVCESDEILESEELEDGLDEYVESEISEEFSSFATNSGYDTEIDAVFLVVDDPFQNGLDLTFAKAMLDDEVKRLKLEVCGKFGVVGGMYVW